MGSALQFPLAYSTGLPKKFPSCLPFQTLLFLNFLSLNTKPEVLVSSASSFTPPEETFHLEPSDYYLRASLIPSAHSDHLHSLIGHSFDLSNSCLLVPSRTSSPAQVRLLTSPPPPATPTIFHRKGGITKASKVFFFRSRISLGWSNSGLRASPLSACWGLSLFFSLFFFIFHFFHRRSQRSRRERDNEGKL